MFSSNVPSYHASSCLLSTDLAYRAVNLFFFSISNHICTSFHHALDLFLNISSQGIIIIWCWIDRLECKFLLSPSSHLVSGSSLMVSNIMFVSDSDTSQWLIRLKTPKKFTGSKIGAIFWQITSRVTTKNLKIGQRGLFELGPFFSLFLMRKTLSSGQKWFLRPYFPLIRGMFLLRSGLRFSFWALEVPEPRVRKRPY